MKFAKTAISLTLSALVSLAMAGEVKPFTTQDFDALSGAGKPVLLYISAPWCPYCKVQKPILEDLMKQPAYGNVIMLTMDFDSDKALFKPFNVKMQSTVVAFKGTHEVGRLVADTTVQGLRALVDKAAH